ncbi:enoyl-CoA hydratase/isomerase family protein [Rhodococcoides fascians]|uniref:enoyl-CoA hydratase/isomerase family protein n=1 Tax=Rhodococcoides fascians TaxID=1828 RepID=UPI0006916F16|nr:enoyl-CoA hydratase/isomerase family protein [Rhodococcus fascians]
MSKPVVLDRRGAVVTIRLSAPPFNAFDTAMRVALGDAVKEVADDESVRCAVVWGGPACFAAGADISALAAMGFEEVVGWNRALQRTFMQVSQLPFPVIAAMNGYALGGGLELALAADYRIAGERATVGLPEVTLGIIPGSGGTQRLAKQVGTARAKELMMSGRQVRARAALDLGIVEEIVADDAVYDHALALADRLARGPRHALTAIKEAVDNSGDGYALERSLIAGLFATTDKNRGMQSFLAQGPGKAEFT